MANLTTRERLRSTTMVKNKRRYPDRRQPLSGTGIWQSEEFVFGITRGACVPARRNSGRSEREFLEAKKTFEETYPSYPFSELVRLSIGLGNLLARVLRKSASNASRTLPDEHATAPKSLSGVSSDQELRAKNGASGRCGPDAQWPNGGVRAQQRPQPLARPRSRPPYAAS